MRATYYRHHNMFRTTTPAHMCKQISLLFYGHCSGKTKNQTSKIDRAFQKQMWNGSYFDITNCWLKRNSTNGVFQESLRNLKKNKFHLIQFNPFKETE